MNVTKKYINLTANERHWGEKTDIIIKTGNEHSLSELKHL